MPSNIKQEIHDFVNAIQDEEQLSVLHEAAAFYVRQSDILDNLTTQQVNELQQAKEQIANGESYTSEEVSLKIKSWVAEHTK